MTDDEIKKAFGTDNFWLLVRRFSTSSPGEARERAMQAIFNYIANNVGERDLKP